MHKYKYKKYKKKDNSCIKNSFDFDKLNFTEESLKKIDEYASSIKDININQPITPGPEINKIVEDIFSGLNK